MRFMVTDLLRRGRSDSRQLVSPIRIEAVKIGEIEHYRLDIFILTDLSDNLAYLSHAVRPEDPREETWEVAVCPDVPILERVLRKQSPADFSFVSTVPEPHMHHQEHVSAQGEIRRHAQVQRTFGHHVLQVSPDRLS